MVPEGMHRDTAGNLLTSPPRKPWRAVALITTCWEPGTRCAACGVEFVYGEEMLHGRHISCARERAESRDEGEDAVELARGKLAGPGRIVFTARQLRALITAAAVQPVRRPDAGRKVPVYGRVSGWSAERVAAGLSAPEVAGLWLDFLDIGKIPPVRHSDLEVLLAAIDQSRQPPPPRHPPWAWANLA
jgi:hypothetical protein